MKLPADTTRKLSTRYTGPFKILEVIGPVNYKLDIPEEWIKKRVHPVFHINLLKRHVPTIDSEGSAEHIVDIEPYEQEPEYEVDKIIGKFWAKTNKWSTSSYGRAILTQKPHGRAAMWSKTYRHWMNSKRPVKMKTR